jgi:hypothetical protein
MSGRKSNRFVVRRGNEISELKEVALAMAKKKLMKLMNVFVTVDYLFYTTLPYSNFLSAM